MFHPHTMKTRHFAIPDLADIKRKALAWCAGFDTACYLDTNDYSDTYSAFEGMVACGAEDEFTSRAKGAFNGLDQFLEKHKGRYVPGFLGYDLKNDVEELSSENFDGLEFPDTYFFVPRHQVIIRKEELIIISDDPGKVYTELMQQQLVMQESQPVSIRARMSKMAYMDKVNSLKKHIHQGDIYEINFCQEFYANDTTIDPVSLFHRLNIISPTPFATFFKKDGHFILSATPERFLSKKQGKLISQPIKGTARRDADTQKDRLAKEGLLDSEKERAENVMIVDLVRNDLTKSAVPGTVRVEELFGIYSFRQVHQMISTVVCDVREGLSNTEILANTFPMGSMTGAPKIRAMQLAEKFEESKRGIYSGAIGYFAPNGDFDFNVVIRTILYNAGNQYLSYQVGGAITAEAEAEYEYNECLLKAEAMVQVLKAKG